MLKFRQPQNRPVIEFRSYVHSKYTRIEVKDNGLDTDLKAYGENCFRSMHAFISI